jgi:hypothetical protein
MSIAPNGYAGSEIGIRRRCCTESRAVKEDSEKEAEGKNRYAIVDGWPVAFGGPAACHHAVQYAGSPDGICEIRYEPP